MIYGIVIFVVIILIAWSGVFDFDSSNKETENKKEVLQPNPWKYNKTTAQLYFDLYLSEPSNGKYFLLKIGENNFAAMDVLDYPPDASSKNQLLLDMDNRVYDFPEHNLSEMLGPCKIHKNEIKIFFADKSSYHNGVSEPPFEYMSFEGVLKNKTLIFDIKQRYYDQTYKKGKIRTLKENVHFNQL